MSQPEISSADANPEWTPSSWRERPVAQSVQYPDEGKLGKVLTKIEKLPPLVTPSEIERLRYQLSLVQKGQAFLLHAGDCAESFDACTHENISAKIGLILSFSLILLWGSRLPIVRIGRIAGQYAKPRSSGTEKIGDREVTSFRGDNVNGLDPDDRTPDPERLLSAYFHSTTTLNYVRSLLTSGFASLHHPRDWSFAHVRSKTLRSEFQKITSGLADALDFTQTIGLGSSGPEAASYERGGGRGVLGEVDFWTSHEGLMLPYEQALTRKFAVPASVALPSKPTATATSTSTTSSTPPQSQPEAHYNTSAHFLWIGDRTRQLDGAHVEYFRGVRNPIGIKVGPGVDGEGVVGLLEILNPERESGRITLITRYGAGKVENHLPGHIKAVQGSGHPVIWVCDPMHGNTHTSTTGLKTRNFSSIISELTSCLRIHADNNSRLGGVSLEFTGEVDEEGFSVTECLGGSMELAEEELGLRYQSFCDPRLNFEQSLDIAFLLSNHLRDLRRSSTSGAGEAEGARRGRDVLFAELGGKI
ncbi:DAHP synthetase [Stereum hirsutum FP-91666 SS1]|uniref:DAHP synthetase n=1 Tax=Stereum hirsutum (strain FP-91666) TaxID=721885 RepID=UPI000440E9A3|nr:DAHP synthetase [Stereum hirsutum FP-91666 SS1]EIM89401.1 DAHP synthetase [Stereum hirsutum FP-91666 SS1]